MSTLNTTNECLIKTNVAKISLNKFKELFRLFNSRNLIQITYRLNMVKLCFEIQNINYLILSENQLLFEYFYL